MASTILDGRLVSNLLREDVKHRVTVLKEKGITPRLEAIVASQDPSSMAYVKMKRAWAEKAGMLSGQWFAGESTTQKELIAHIQNLNADPTVHGVLLQHPLPKHLDENAALIELGSSKDADGISPESLGKLVAGMSGFRCATPFGIIKLLEHYDVPLEGKRAIVIGRSVILGKPMALMLLEKNATVTIAHSKTTHLAELCKEADIVVAAVGRPEMIRGSWIKPGAIVIDAGYNKVEGRDSDVGDVHFGECAEIASAITPVPGGVGPMTVATLLSNTVDAAESLLT